MSATTPAQGPERASLRAALRGDRTTLLALLLLAAFLALAVSSMRVKNVTVDEITYLAAGTYHLRTGDFHYNQTNPALLKLWAGAPLVLLGAELPPMDGSPRRWSQIEQWRWARAFLYGNRVDADRMLFAARLPTLVLATLLGLLVFAGARSLYGDGAGLLALSLYAFSPHVLAHGRLATQDLGLAALLFATLWAFVWTLARPSPGRVLGCGVLLGLTVSAKVPAVFLLPVLGLEALVRALAPPRDGAGLGAGPVRRVAVLTGVFLGLAAASALTVDLVYGFQDVFVPWSPEPVGPERFTSLPPGLRALAVALVGLPIPLPDAYLECFRFLQTLEAHSSDVFFAGRLHPGGLWYLLPGALLIKTPVPTLVLWAAGLVCVPLLRRRPDAERPMLLFVGSQLAIYAWFSHVGEGVRYLLPIVPVLCVLAGATLAPGRWPPRPRRAAAALLAAGAAASALLAHPDYIPYANRLAGGSSATWRLLAGSNVDWGQDLLQLRRYLDERGIERIKLGYFGSGDAAYYGIDYDYLPSVGLAPRAPGERWWYELGRGESFTLAPQTGWIAVSANLVHGQLWVERMFGPAYAWLDEHEPVDQVGHSILVYHIDPEGADAADASAGR